MTEQQMREYWENAGGSFEPGFVERAVIPADVLFAFLLAIAKPIDMVLHCPACGLQHIDGPDNLHVWDGRDQSGRNHVSNEGPGAWSNPPHRSHLCHGCGHVWRPADVPTNGVQAANTKGEADSPIAVPARQAPAGAAGIPGNFITHRPAWRKALGIAKAHASGDDVSYWEHELRAFDRSFDRLWALMQDTATAQPAPAAEFTTGDADIDALLNETANLQRGPEHNNMDTALLWQSCLEKVLARLKAPKGGA